MIGLKEAHKYAVIAVCLLAAGCAPTQQQRSTYGSSDPQPAQVPASGNVQCFATTDAENRSGADATNNTRRQAGLPAVRANATLAKVAAQHACDMAKRGRMTHVGSSSAGPASRIKAMGYMPTLTAENVAVGPNNLNQVLAVWRKSSGHLANIRNPQVRDFGIGHAIGADGKTHFWAAVYAAPR